MRRALAGILLLSAAALPLRAQPIRTLPKAVRAVSFGTAHRYSGGGKEMCAVLKPLPPPVVFPAGTRELTYTVELEPKTVVRASARVTGQAPQPLAARPCNIYAPIPGGFSQTQIGSTLSRTDGAPILPGRYTLRIDVDGQVAEITFHVE